MGKNTSFSIGQHFSDFVESMIGEGRYGSASDVVRAGLTEYEASDLSGRNAGTIWADVSDRARSA